CSSTRASEASTPRPWTGWSPRSASSPTTAAPSAWSPMSARGNHASPNRSTCVAPLPGPPPSASAPERTATDPTQDSGAACIALRPVQAPDQAARAGPRVNLPVRARTIALVWGPDHLARSGPPLSRSVRQVGEAGGELAGVLGLDPLVPVPAHFRAAGGGGQHPQHIGRALPHHHRIHLRIMADLIDPDRFAADPADHRMQPVGSARDQ